MGKYTKEEIKKYELFLEEYLKIKGINTKKLMRCFSKTHEDKHPSMSYYKKGNICFCFACKEKYNIFKLVGQEYGITNKEKQIDKVKELYENKELIKDINKIYSQKGATVEINNKIQDQYNSINKFNVHFNLTKENMEEVKKYSNYLKKIHEIAMKQENNYFDKRGISREIQEKFMLGYDPDFSIYLDNYKKFKPFKMGAAIIKSYGSGCFTARNIDDNSTDKYRKVGKSLLFNGLIFETNKKNENLFVVEGEFDALSIETVGKNAIGLGTIYNSNQLIEKIKKYPKKFNYILILDNDKNGRESQKELYNKINLLGEKVCECKNFLENYKDPNEFLMKDKEKFKNKIEKLDNFFFKNIERKIPKKEKKIDRENQR